MFAKCVPTYIQNFTWLMVFSFNVSNSHSKSMCFTIVNIHIITIFNPELGFPSNEGSLPRLQSAQPPVGPRLRRPLDVDLLSIGDVPYEITLTWDGNIQQLWVL